jgi:phosphatidylglycerophosphatase A
MAATHWLGWPSDWPDTALLALLTLLVGLISSNYYIKSLASETSGDTDEHLDPGCVVIDEWAGMLITLCGASHLSAKEVIAAFVLFRLFDILKPPPVSTAEKFPGAWGVMFDDVVAGFLALGVLSILLNLSLF